MRRHFGGAAHGLADAIGSHQEPLTMRGSRCVECKLLGVGLIETESILSESSAPLRFQRLEQQGFGAGL
jgi:hypothetical protein